MVINSQTPYEVQADGMVKFFVDGVWQNPVPLPDFLKLPNFLRYSDWEYDTGSDELVTNLGDGAKSAPVNPPTAGGGGGGGSATVTNLNAGDLSLTAGVTASGANVYSQTSNIIHLRLNLLIGSGTTKNYGDVLCTLPVGARPQVSQHYAIAADETGTHFVRAVEINQNGNVIARDGLNQFTFVYLAVSYIAA